jgi:hypothetical protein
MRSADDRGAVAEEGSGTLLSLGVTRRGYTPWLIFLIGFAVRFVYVMTDVSIPVVNDMGVYHQLAMGLLSGEGYHTDLEPHFKAFRPPGYPFFLTALYYVFGPNPAVVLFSHALMGAMTCVLVYWIGRDCWSQRVGLVAGILCCVNPEAIHWSREFLTETLFIFLLVLLVFLCVRLSSEGGRVAVVAAGLVLGYATLTRPNVLVLIPFLVLYFLFCTDLPLRRRVVVAISLPLLCLLTLLPWSIRNYHVLDAFVPVASIGGFALYVSVPPERGTAPYSLPTWQYLEIGVHKMPNGYEMAPELFGEPPPESPLIPSDFNEVDESKRGREFYIRHVLMEPKRFMGLLATKASLMFNVRPRLFRPDSGEDYGFGLRDIVVRVYSSVFNLLIFAFAALGAIASFNLRKPIILIGLVFAYHVAFQLVFRPALRYFLPGLVLCSVLAAIGLVLTASPRVAYASQGRSAPWKLSLWGFALVVLATNTYYQLWVLRRPGLLLEWKWIQVLFGIG